MQSSAFVPLMREIEPAMPIVTMSGLVPEGELGVGPGDPFLPKPFRPDDLLVMVQTALAR